MAKNNSSVGVLVVILLTPIVKAIGEKIADAIRGERPPEDKRPE